MYLRQEMNLRDLSVQLAESFAERILSTPNDRSFLSQLIHYEKIQYIKQMIIPDFSEDRIMGYTQNNLNGQEQMKKEIWNFLYPKSCFLVLTKTSSIVLFFQLHFQNFI